MAYFVLVGLTLISCFLFEFSQLGTTLKNLTSSYKEQFRVMSDKALEDEDKQKLLMGLVTKQLGLILRLILGILLFVAPFFSLFLLEKWNSELTPDILITFWGIILPLISVFIYILLKKVYVRIFRNG